MYFIQYNTVNNLTHAGSGKTYLAAFDVLNFNPKRLLYIVHEGSILMKSVETFSRVFGVDKTYGIYNADYKEFYSDFVFSTNVTMANSLELFEPHTFDYIIIDEAHRLHQYKNISYMGSFKSSCERIGLTTESDELDWVLHQCNCAILFYDKDQVVGPSGIDAERFENKIELAEERYKRLTTYCRLVSQMRVNGGNDYIDQVNRILSGKAREKKTFDNYEFKEIRDFRRFDQLHYDLEKAYGLTRMTAGYAWEWASKNDKSQTDIEIDGVAKQWNYMTEGWIHADGAVNQVGCIHSTQGYDPVKREILVRPNCYYDQNGKKTATYEELKTYILHIYYVLMTRGIRGTYLYVCDKYLRTIFQM